MSRASIVTIVTILLLSSCSNVEKDENRRSRDHDLNGNRSEVIEDGIYLIKGMAKAKEALKKEFDNEEIIDYSHAFIDDKTEEIKYYLIQTDPFVPLIIKSAPTIMENSGRLNELNITLASQYSQQLEDFTRENVGRRVAIVIGGEAVTRHKVKTAIEGGRLKITRCTDHACKYLLTELENNVK